MNTIELKQKLTERLESIKIIIKLVEERRDWYGCIYYGAIISELESILKLIE